MEILTVREHDAIEHKQVWPKGEMDITARNDVLQQQRIWKALREKGDVVKPSQRRSVYSPRNRILQLPELPKIVVLLPVLNTSLNLAAFVFCETVNNQHTSAD